MDKFKLRILFVLICFVQICLLVLVTGNNIDRQKRDLEIVEMVNDLTDEVLFLQDRIESVENRPEIMIQNATVFNTEEEIIIKETN